MKKDILKKFLSTKKMIESDIFSNILGTNTLSLCSRTRAFELAFNLKLKIAISFEKKNESNSLFNEKQEKYKIRGKDSKAINPKKEIIFNMLSCPSGTLISCNDVGVIPTPPYYSTDRVKYVGSKIEINKPLNIHIETNGFWLGEMEVTQDLWESITGWNSAGWQYHSLGMDDIEDKWPVPMENITWLDAILFCNALSRLANYKPCFSYSKIERQGGHIVSMENLKWDKNANGFRLPTILEWIYAAKANSNFKFSGSDDPNEISWPRETYSIEHYDSIETYVRDYIVSLNKKMTTYPIGLFEPNGWGFCDMNGNVSEMVLNTNTPQSFIVLNNEIIDIDMLNDVFCGSGTQSYALGGGIDDKFESSIGFFKYSTQYNDPNKPSFKFRNSPNDYLRSEIHNAYSKEIYVSKYSNTIGLRLARNMDSAI